MNPSEKGWLRTYLRYRLQTAAGPAPRVISLIEEAPDSAAYLYRLIQPTGLMYGYPISFIEPSHPTASDWREKEKIKVLMAESYLSCGLYYHHQAGLSARHVYSHIITDIRDFYVDRAGDGQRLSQLFGRSKAPIDQIEYLLDRRISIRYNGSNFWTSFFHNSLLFLDLILYLNWKEPERYLWDLKPEDLRVQLRLDMLRLIAAAAHSDEVIQPEERELFTYFLHSAELPTAAKREAQQVFERGMALEELKLSSASPWILRKYFLELAILTTWANRQISAAEREFLRQLALQLELGPHELHSSMQAIEHFVKNYWQQVHYLQVKHNYRIVSERLVARMRYLARKNQRLIGQEILESRELVYLLRKSTHEELSPQEREKVRAQLLDILRSIPAFALLLLPGAFITLPILFRVIPKHLLYPSAFVEPRYKGEAWPGEGPEDASGEAPASGA